MQSTSHQTPIDYKENRILPETAGNLMVIETGTKITLDDYRNLYFPKILELISEYDDFRLVATYNHPFLGWEIEAAGADFESMIKWGKKLVKVALVDPPAIASIRWRSLQVLIGDGEIRNFEEGQLQEAIDWAKA